jgi:alpha-1,2-mannosyltransferase
MHIAARRLFPLAVGVALAAAAAVLLAKGVARIHHDDVIWGLAGWQVPGDFGVFLGAGDRVLDGLSPYPEVGTLQPPPAAYFVYPPVLALLITPLSALPIGVASTIFTLLGIGAIVCALLVLDVRDWRCHVVGLLYPFTREALEYGAIGSFLLLLIALAWRWRDRLAAPSLATAGAVVLKVFLWPLLLWFVMTRRVRAAMLAATAGIGLALLAWAAIAFRGLLDYPRLLRDLSELEAAHTHSVFAILRALEVPSLVAQALVLASGLVLVALAVREANAPGRPARERDRRSLTLVVAAALVLTPIMWLHYLVLLLLPIALARPRLSALWLVPLAAVVPSWLGWYGGWTNGELDALLSPVPIVAAVVIGSLWSASVPRGRAAQTV